MKELKISAEKLQALLNFISEIPFKYAKPLIDEFGAIVKEQAEVEQVKTDTSVKDLKDTKNT